MTDKIKRENEIHEMRVEQGRKMGLANKKTNVIYRPIRCDYSLVYVGDGSSYTIVDSDREAVAKEHTWYKRTRDHGKVDAYTKINNKTIYLNNYLMGTDTENGKQCDHINGEPRDNRTVNLRNGTQGMNLLNTKKAKDVDIEILEKDDKFIVHFSGFNKDLEFDTKEEAENALKEYQQFSYEKSQEIAKEIETNQFAIEKYQFIGGALEKISQLKENHICKIKLTNAYRDFHNGLITEDELYTELFRIEGLYNEIEKDNLNSCNGNKYSV